MLSCAFIFIVSHQIFANDKPLVFVSIVPQKYFVQQIGKNLVDIRVMVQPGANPHTYEPKPRQMTDLSKTKIFFTIGVSFEYIWLGKNAAVNPNMRVVHTDHGIEKLAMAAHHHHDDPDEHHEGEHHDKGVHDHKKGAHLGMTAHEKDHRKHAGLDPHIWLSPPPVKMQARTILAAIQEVDPGHANVYDANFRKFTAQLD
jgi:zinc transport system substrate-binding protein